MNIQYHHYYHIHCIIIWGISPPPGQDPDRVEPAKAQDVFIPIYYRGHVIGNLRADVIIHGEIVIEFKTIRALTLMGQRARRPHWGDRVIHICMYVCMYVYIYIYVYMYIQYSVS